MFLATVTYKFIINNNRYLIYIYIYIYIIFLYKIEISL